MIPAPGALTYLDCALIALSGETQSTYHQALAEFALQRALGAVWDLIGATNKYIVQVEPWALAKRVNEARDHGAAERLNTTLYLMAESLRLIAHYLVPFLPHTAAAIGKQLGVTIAQEADLWCKALGWGELSPGTQVQSGEILFVKQP